MVWVKGLLSSGVPLKSFTTTLQFKTPTSISILFLFFQPQPKPLTIAFLLPLNLVNHPIRFAPGISIDNMSGNPPPSGGGPPRPQRTGGRNVAGSQAVQYTAPVSNQPPTQPETPSHAQGDGGSINQSGGSSSAAPTGPPQVCLHAYALIISHITIFLNTL